jgi:methionyl-tRNA synthetase
MRRFYITTPIYYVNDVPHLGHAYTTIAADAVRRYHLLRGDETRMLTGTDEHGLKIERAAAEAKTTPEAFAEKMSARFRTVWEPLDVKTDDFIRTTEARHIEVVQDLWKRIQARGDLYLGDYEDWYCVGCESYKTEKELLPGNICPLHNKPVERLKEQTYFFRLSKWEKPLLDFYRRKPSFIAPETRRNEVLSFVESGLRDLSCSRTSFTWGIPVPGDPKHVMYVWFDALTNYLSALGKDGDPLRRFWPPQGTCVHLVGKDILRFHAVYWPAFLLAAGYREDELPSQVFAHGFLTVDGQKMSKSLQNAVDPLRLAKELGADAVRYQLLRAIAFGQDGDLDHAAMLERYNADLGKNLGNLLSRTLGLCTKLTAGKTPKMGVRSKLEDDLWADVQGTLDKQVTPEWERLAIHSALAATWSISSRANQYVDQAAPWTAAKNGDAARVGTILATLLEVLRWLSVLVWPAMPRKSDAMRAQLGLLPLAPKAGEDLWALAVSPRAEGGALAPAGALFPTYDEAGVQAMLDKLVGPDRSRAPLSTSTTTTSSTTPSTSTAASTPTSPSTSPSTPTSTIPYEHFASIDLRVGLVKSCEKVPKKDKLLRLEVDVGEPSPRTIIAGLALSFTPEALVGRRVVVVANLAPRDFGKGLVSHGMLLATGPSEALQLATVDAEAPPGARLK